MNGVARGAHQRALGGKGHGRRRPAVGRVGETADLTTRAVFRRGARQRRAGAAALRYALRRHRIGQATLLRWRASAVEPAGDPAVEARRRRCGHPAVGLIGASAAGGDQHEHAGMPRPPRPRPSHARSLGAAPVIGSVSRESPLASNGPTGTQTTGTTDNRHRLYDCISKLETDFRAVLPCCATPHAARGASRCDVLNIGFVIRAVQDEGRGARPRLGFYAELSHRSRPVHRDGRHREATRIGDSLEGLSQRGIGDHPAARGASARADRAGR